MEEERKLKLVTKPENALTQEQFDRLFPSRSNDDIEKIADIFATKVNTKLLNDEFKKTNEKIEAQNTKIDALQNGIAQLINEFKKQSVDENNSSFKLARNNSNANIPISSLASHITHVIGCAHIAKCYRLMTDKNNDKISVQKARQMLIGLNLIEDVNFVGKILTSSTTAGRKYHFSILSEIKKRLSNPTHYGISLEVSEKWRHIAFIPNDEEIQTFIAEIFALLE